VGIEFVCRIDKVIGGSPHKENPWGRVLNLALYSEADISSEQMEEIRQLCERVFVLEAEQKRLELTIAHLEDDKTFELTYEQLASNGFEL
jgi:hypothetical protein